jgi:hydrogenase expression/formation protein HypC
MCLAMPAKVIELCDGEEAVVDLDGVKKRISLALVEGIAPGDYVILHAGYALQKLDIDEAEETLALFREIAADPGSAQ